MVPLWSSVKLMPQDPTLEDALAQLKERSGAGPFKERVASLQREVSELLRSEKIAEAYEITRRALPDARIMVEPTITGHAMRSTPNATANATLHCLAAAIKNDHRLIHGQVLLQGEFMDLDGICGVPLNITRQGWQIARMETLTTDEQGQVRRAADSIAGYLSSVASNVDQLIEIQ